MLEINLNICITYFYPIPICTWD